MCYGVLVITTPTTLINGELATKHGYLCRFKLPFYQHPNHANAIWWSFLLFDSEIFGQGLGPNTLLLFTPREFYHVCSFWESRSHIMHLKESFYFITEKLMSFIRHFRCNFIMSRVSTNPKRSSFKKALVELHALTCTISKPLCNLNSYTHYFKSFHLYIYNIPMGFVWVRIASHLMPILRCWFCRPRRNWRV